MTKHRDTLPTYCGQYKANVKIRERIYEDYICHIVNVRPVGRRYNNDLAYFYCGDCNNFFTDNDEEICNNSFEIFESDDCKIYCKKYEARNEQ